ncbi:MAG: triose-phosphate isomerase [archaeon]
MAYIGVIAQNFEIYDGDGYDPFARTGDISSNQIFKAGASGVILGHSEAGDSPEIINKKLLSVIKKSHYDLSSFRFVILVGESRDEFETNSAQRIAEMMMSRLGVIFRDVPGEFMSSVILGYEPKWGSRGSGRDDMSPPQPELISLCIQKMRLFVKIRYGDGATPYFIYGGRSTPERTRQVLRDRNIDGLILGSACNTVGKALDIACTMKDVCGDRKKVLVCNFKAYDLADSYEDYISELSKLDDDFVVCLAPPYTDIRSVKSILERKGF